jgi:hypothetical protein
LVHFQMRLQDHRQIRGSHFLGGSPGEGFLYREEKFYFGKSIPGKN